ncbi:hypothetical protein P7K49_037116 [Saguinus oedipus]|uniref:Uncharacterized protein n=1 Tax=Saguinus oedipus TaxID=9490 RepID=A0ABQ9TI14_SAGOE|nr:hypothetical protein P7K49_037116 [Saguinus oedipus]
MQNKHSVTEVKVEAPEYLGPLLFVKPRKRHLLQDDAWFCSWISIVQGPGVAGDDVRFPCYRWVEGDGILSLTEGTGHTVFDNPQGLFRKPREEELEERRKWYWLADLTIKDTFNVLTCWKDLDDFNWIFWCGQSKLAGANPMVLRLSSRLPTHLVFPPGMEELQAQLQKEVEGGTLFEADFSLLDGIKANVILCSQQHLAAPLVMLKVQPDGKLLPMVIQLQLPSTGTPPPPLFLPMDPPVVWLLAKCWVHSSDFQLHELQSHLLRGHLVAEVIAVAIRRYVEGIVSLYYKTHVAVKGDTELQTWCQKLTEIGLLGAQNRGFPVSLQSQEQLCHFLTMCIFTCTGQHSSVHLGQHSSVHLGQVLSRAGQLGIWGLE